MDDVARSAGVSKGAVSKVIRNAYGVSDEMRERVEKTIEELGYRPRIAARAMRGSSFSIGLEVPNLGNAFLTQIMQGATEQLAGTHYQLIIAPGLGEMRGTPVLENLIDRQVDGLIAISPDVTPVWLEKLAVQVPIVLVGRHDQSENYDTVTDDDAAGIRLAFDHLRSLGHERIAHFTMRLPADDGGPQTPHARRLATYRTLMAECGAQPRVAFCDDELDDAYAVAREMLSADPSITAVLAGHDALALVVQRALADLGRSSRDVSVIGYDDIPISSHPLVSLSSVTQFGERIGRVAITLLLERITGERSSARHYQIQPELRVRSSTQPSPERSTGASR